MATVYRGRHASLGAAHALKVLRVDVPEIKRRLIAEGKVQSSIRHPNVVSVTDIVDTEQGVALVMEFVDGPALDEYQDDRPLPISEVCELFRGIALGVGEAHRKGVVHRDLKSANVLLHRTSNAGVIPKVTDFGLVKVFEGGGTRSGVTMGTPEYMSPEQVRDSARVDPRSDLWSLGVLLYEMLTGTVPFDGTDLLVIYNAIASGEFVSVQDVRPDCPPWLSGLVDALLVVDPEGRLQSIEAVLEAFDAERAPVLEVAATPAERTPAWPLLVGALGVAVLGALLCAGAVGLGLRYQRPTAPVERGAQVAIQGLPPGTPTAVWVDGERYVDRTLVELPARVLPAEVTVRWAYGAGCEVCPQGCPDWCMTGERSFGLEPGEGAALLPLVLPAPQLVDVVVNVNQPLSQASLGEMSGRVEDGTVTFSDVAQGGYELLLEVGECADTARGCAAREDCPAGCVSHVEGVAVRPLPPGPERTIQLAAPVVEVVPEVVVVAAPSGGSLVSGRAYAGWIRRHPEWEKTAAVQAKRADAGYLRDWAPDPPSGPVTRVTWAAAKAYCASRGGLLPLDAAPLTWSSASAKQEWRSAGGRPAWRRQDGETSTQASANRAFPLTGFRCSR
jgi:hypothetical protein